MFAIDKVGNKLVIIPFEMLRFKQTSLFLGLPLLCYVQYRQNKEFCQSEFNITEQKVTDNNPRTALAFSTKEDAQRAIEWFEAVMMIEKLDSHRPGEGGIVRFI